MGSLHDRSNFTELRKYNYDCIGIVETVHVDCVHCMFVSVVVTF